MRLVLYRDVVAFRRTEQDDPLVCLAAANFDGPLVSRSVKLVPATHWS